MRILFILKHPDSHFSGYFSSGLLNSADFIVEMLKDLGHHAKAVQVIDNNGIDREVSKYNPDHVILEALWVVPDKFHVLTHLHPRVHWSVRVHSNTPFLSNEGMAFDWLLRYHHFSQVDISTNSKALYRELSHFIGHNRVVYLPNYYPVEHYGKPLPVQHKPVVDIGCFGAIRPLKNQMIQAIAAIHFSERIKKNLRFHINASRREQGGNNVLKNIRHLFSKHRAELVEHPWLEHEEFIKLIKTMDLGMAVSYSETFCIVAADFVNAGVPIITSPQIDWMDHGYMADPNDSDDIAKRLWHAWVGRNTNKQEVNRWALGKYSSDSKIIWHEWLNEHPHHWR